MTLRIALLGAGRIGQVHARAVSRVPGARLVAVADAVSSAAEAIAGAYGAGVRDVGSIASAGDVDAVLICTPTDTHAALIERFARAGKAVFCEKPVALDVARVRACLAVVEAAGVPLMVGFNRRFDPHFTVLKQVVDDGAIGEVEQITITSRDPGLPPAAYIRASGGIFRDMTIHDFDMARFLLPGAVTSVFATASALIAPEIRQWDDYDTATVVLGTADGRQVTIQNSRRASYGYDQRIEVFGSLGMVQAENQRPADIVLATERGFTRPPLHDFFMTRYTAAYEAEIAAFVVGATGGGQIAPTGDDGLAALLLAEAAAQSVARGEAVAVAMLK